MLMLDIAVVNTALPHIARDLHASFGGLQWVVDAYTLSLAATVLTAGSIADRRGRRRVFAVGLGLFTVSSLVCAVAGSIEALDIARAVQGLGAAALFATALAILAHTFPEARERAGALAIWGATVAASFAVGPLVGGALTTGLGWRAIFFVNLPLGLIALAYTLARVQESRDPNARALDWPGQITLTGGLFLLVLALLRGNDDGWSSTAILAELGGAAALLSAFMAFQRRSREPMLPLHLFRVREFAAAQISVFAISASFFAVFLYTTLYLQNVLGLSAIAAGAAYLPGTVVMFFVSAATANLSGKVSTRTMVAGGLVLVAIGQALFLLATATSSWTIILPGELVALIGTGLFNPAASALALQGVPAEQSGLASGANDTFRQAGIAVGVAALGAMIPAHGILTGGSHTAYVDGLHTALIVGAGLAAAGALATLALLREKRPAVVTPRLATEAA
jgi:EmrB/QacA subfamily drug resistance transporter